MSSNKTLGWGLALLLALAWMLSGCGGNADGGKAQLRAYESEKGTVQIPVKAERVVVAVPDYVGDVIAAGVVPVGAPDMVFKASYYTAHLKGTENIGSDVTASLEKVISLQPDLILTYHEESYEALSKIAPTVMIPYGKYEYRERLQEISRILGREKEGNKWLEQFDKAVADKKKQLKDVIAAGKTVAILEIWEKELYLYGRTFGRGGAVIYDELGIAAPAKVKTAAFEQGWAALSLETIPDILGEADYLLRGLRDPSGANKSSVEGSSIWKGLKAVKNNAVYDYNVDDFYFQDPIALRAQLDAITEFLVKK